MPDEIKKTHGVMVKLTTQVEFLAFDPPAINGGEPSAMLAGAMRFQGGGVIVPKAWKDAADKGGDVKGELVRELLKQAMEQVPAEIIAAFADLGQKAYNGDEPSRLIKPGMRDTLAMQGGEVRKVKPS